MVNYIMQPGVQDAISWSPGIGWVLFPVLGFLIIPAIISTIYLLIQFRREDRYLAYYRLTVSSPEASREVRKGPGKAQRKRAA